MTFASDRRGRMTELLKGLCPPDSFASAKFTEAFRAATNEVKAYGCNHDCAGYSMDTNGLGNVRWQHSGKREVVMIRWEGFLALAKHKKVDMAPNEEVPSYMKRLCKDLAPEDLELQAFKEHVFYHEHGPEEVLVTPPGFAVIESAAFFS